MHTIVSFLSLITLAHLALATPAPNPTPGLLNLALGSGGTSPPSAHAQQIPGLPGLPGSPAPRPGLPIDGQRPLGCNTADTKSGTVQCCDTTQKADALGESGSLLGSLLGFAGLGANGLVGLTCNPVRLPFLLETVILTAPRSPRLVWEVEPHAPLRESVAKTSSSTGSLLSVRQNLHETLLDFRD
jgi:hypothetical protein